MTGVRPISWLDPHHWLKIETIIVRAGLSIMRNHEDHLPTSRCVRPDHQEAVGGLAEGLFTSRQHILPRRRSLVDGVSSFNTCGLRMPQSVKATNGWSLSRQVRGSSCVSGSRDTTSYDSVARGLGKTARVQVGRERHDRQHPKRKQSDLLRLQTLYPLCSVLVRPSVVLEEEVVVPYKDKETRLAKQKTYSKTWYQKNRKEVIKKSAVSRARSKREWFAYKAKQRCSHCGAKHLAIIDFHHVIKEGKRSVNDLAVKKSNVREAIKEAEEKCIPLCSNCHRIFHWNEHRQRRKKQRGKK